MCLQRFWFSLRSNWFIYHQSLRLIVACAPKLFVFFNLTALILSFVPVLQVWFSKRIVDMLVAKEGVGALWSAFLYIIMLAVPAILLPLQQMVMAWLGNRLVTEIDRRLMQAAKLLIDLPVLEQAQFQNEVSLLNKTMWITIKFFRIFESGAGLLITLIGLLILLGSLHPLLPLIMLLLMLPQLFIERNLLNVTHATMQRQISLAREMDYCVQIATDPQAAKELRVFGLSDFFLQRFRHRFRIVLKEMTRLRWRGLWGALPFIALHALVLAGGFWYVAWSADRGSLKLGDLTLYVNAFVQMEIVLGSIRVAIGLAYEGLIYFRRFFAVLEQAQPVIKLLDTAHAQKIPRLEHQDIEFCHVSFAYPESQQVVLQNVSFKLPAGKVTALVGINGVGKSTVVKLLARMYDPASGEIRLNGMPLWQYDLVELRRQIAVVYQDFACLALTLRDNIAIGSFDSDKGEEQAQISVEEAAKWSGAVDVLHKLPAGYDNELTRYFENGIELSGGEWQKIALARAFVRDASLIVLDEPTSALDADAEDHLFEQFREIVQGKTALLISHRFSTVRMADQIVVLENGSVIEAGNHAELLAQRGRYAQFFSLQADRYR